MIYVKFIEDTPVRITLEEVRRSHPSVSFPREVSNELLAEYGVYPCEVETPEFNPRNQYLVEGAVELRDGTWVQTRTVQDLPRDLLLETAVLDRAEFCNGLADLGVISDAEAIEASKGNWPSTMVDFLGYLDPRQRRDAQIIWASCLTIERTHWLILSMISMGLVTEAQVDELFGIG